MEDAESLFKYAQNPSVSQYTSWNYHKSIQDSLDFIQKTMASYNEKDIGPLAICLKHKPNEVIGSIQVMVATHAYEGELAYALSQDFWRQGITLEAAKFIVDLGFTEKGFKRIFARCAQENEPSQKFLNKLGMTSEGCLRKRSYNKNRFWDVKFYSILFEEWRKN